MEDISGDGMLDGDSAEEAGWCFGGCATTRLRAWPAWPAWLEESAGPGIGTLNVREGPAVLGGGGAGGPGGGRGAVEAAGGE